MPVDKTFSFLKQQPILWFNVVRVTASSYLKHERNSANTDVSEESQPAHTLKEQITREENKRSSVCFPLPLATLDEKRDSRSNQTTIQKIDVKKQTTNRQFHWSTRERHLRERYRLTMIASRTIRLSASCNYHSRATRSRGCDGTVMEPPHQFPSSK